MRPARDLSLALLCLATPVAGDIAYVTNQNDSSLSVIDLNEAREVGRWSVPGQPAGIAVAPGHVWTVSPEAKTVRRYDLDGTVQADTVLDGGPTGIAHDPEHGQLFVSDWFNARIWVLDDRTLDLREMLQTGAAPAGLAVAGGWLVSADRDANQVSLFDTATLALRHRIDVGLRPYGPGFAPDGRLFVANVGTDDVSVIDPEAGRVTATLPVGERPYGVGFARGRVFVTNQYAGSISVFDLETLSPAGTIAAGEYPEGVDTNGAVVVVANWFDNTVSLIDPDTLKIRAEIATGDGPRAFGRFILGDAP